MNDIQSLLELPLETIIVLAAGYMAYRLAYTGKDEKHKATDVVFLSLVFGLVAQTSIAMVPDGHPIVSAAAGVLAALSVAALWRRWGMGVWFKLVRKTNVSISDGRANAWQSMIADDHMNATQIVIKRMDGTMMMCDNLGGFKDAPTNPLILGDDGSVAFYVTHQKGPDDVDWQDISDDIRGKDGMTMTHIPANEIVFTDLRRL